MNWYSHGNVWDLIPRVIWGGLDSPRNWWGIDSPENVWESIPREIWWGIDSPTKAGESIPLGIAQILVVIPRFPEKFLGELIPQKKSGN